MQKHLQTGSQASQPIVICEHGEQFGKLVPAKKYAPTDVASLSIKYVPCGFLGAQHQFQI